MSDKNHEGVPRKLGRGLVKALRGIFGTESVNKIGASADALRSEFEAGRADAAEAAEETETRETGHRELPSRAPDKTRADHGDADSDDA